MCRSDQLYRVRQDETKECGAVLTELDVVSSEFRCQKYVCWILGSIWLLLLLLLLRVIRITQLVAGSRRPCSLHFLSVEWFDGQRIFELQLVDNTPTVHTL